MKVGMQQKFGNFDLNELKIDVVKQEPRQKVQMYFDHLDKLFRKRKVKDVEQRCRFLTYLCLKIRKFYMVKNYTNVEQMLVATKYVERVLGELGATPFEPLKEE
jgi:hypothetical protein